ncbi:hypothetical protein FXO37_13167 [Capsicum annuum]|nr:hypothetical protein FXO37_13167 [Capsicum annuum]
MKYDTKPVNTPLAPHLKLSSRLSSTTDEEREYLSKVPYANAVGNLMYAIVCTRPDISQVVSVVSRYMHDPGKGDLDKRRSTTSYLFALAKAPTVALSTTEIEYMAIIDAVKEAIWLHGLLKDLGVGNSRRGGDTSPEDSYYGESYRYADQGILTAKEYQKPALQILRMIGQQISLPSGEAVVECRPQFDRIQNFPGRGMIITELAPHDSGFDFYSHFFCPKILFVEVCIVPCLLIGVKSLANVTVALQASPRGGVLSLRLDEEKQRVFLRGKAEAVMEEGQLCKVHNMMANGLTLVTLL